MLLGKNLFLIFFLYQIFGFSQGTDSLLIFQNISLALEKNIEGNYDDAYEMINNLQNALERPSQNNFLIAVTNLNKGKIEINLGKYQESVASARTALETFSSTRDAKYIADTYNLLGLGFYYLYNYDSTQVYYKKSYDLKKLIGAEKNELAISSYNLAIAYEDQAKSQEALKLYREAEQLFLQDRDERSLLADVYTGIARLNFYNKDFNEAEKYADKAMEIGLEEYGEFHPNMTFVSTSYANILTSKKKYKEAIQLLHKNLKIREKHFGNRHRWTCESNYDLANAYALDEQYDQAEIYYKEAIVIGERGMVLNNLAIAKTHLAKLYVDQNIMLDDSEELLSDALDYKLSISGKRNEEITEIYNLLAKKALLIHDKINLNYFIEEALKSCRYIDDNLVHLIDPFGALESLMLMNKFYEISYAQTNNIDFLKKKYELIDQELNLIKFMQKHVSSDRSRIQIANNYRQVYENGLNTCWSLYQFTNRDPVYLNKAFELSETNRNTALLEGIQNSQFKIFANIPEEMLNLEQQIKQELAQINLDLYYEQSSNEPDKETLGLLINQRILVSNKIDSLQNALETTFPEYTGLKYNHKIIDIEDVKNDLDEDTQMITYFLGDKNLYTFNITKDNITFLKGDISDKIVNRVSLLKNELLNRQNIDDTTEELYHYLLSQQIDLSKSKMVIIPDNVLNYIPFEILRNENNDFLIENFTISYSGSARLYLELKNKFFDYKLPNYWVGFSPVYNLSNSLSSNLDETKEISELFNGKAFVGNNSSVNNFLENSRENSIVHLAMHVEINNDHPMYNKLIFSDGELTSSKIYVSGIKANLAVLSACNTGFGKLEKGEGVMSMARAFNYSGVPSIVMSLWKIPDKETKKIMIYFYKHLKSGEPKNEALKNAKLDYLAATNDSNLRHPYYWSGFVLNGNTKSLVPIKNDKYYFISGFLLFGSIIIGMRMKNTQV